MEDDRPFGTIIRETREALKAHNPDYTLRKFAKSVNISPTFLSLIENNKFDPPSVETIMLMAEKLNLNPRMLLAKARRLDPEVKEIITTYQDELLMFLRTVNGRSSEEIRTIANIATMAASLPRPATSSDKTNDESNEDKK